MSCRHEIERAEQEIKHMRSRIAVHKAGLNGMTVRGFPTQSTTDLLNKLCTELILLERRTQLLRDGFQSRHW
jgi:ribosome-interacting GTPase 1